MYILFIVSFTISLVLSHYLIKLIEYLVNQIEVYNRMRINRKDRNQRKIAKLNCIRKSRSIKEIEKEHP